MPLLILILFAGLFASSSLTSVPQGGEGLFPTPTPKKAEKGGYYCLTEEEFEEIKSRPLAFTCDRTNLDGTQVLEEDVPYVLAEEDVIVSKVFIHDQKQLILKEICDGTNYYTGKCHPPDYGSIYANTLWRLRDTDPNRTPIKDGDHFDVFLRKDLDSLPERWKCPEGMGANVFLEANTTPSPKSPLEGKMIRIGDISAIWTAREEAVKHDIELAPPREKIAEITIESQEYDVFVNLLIETSPDRDTYLYLVEKGVLPEDNDDLPDSLTYDVFLILKETEIGDKTLKLSTFDPIPPPPKEHGWWETWIPESKPAIYLYPEKPTRLRVKLNPAGKLTTVDPPYDPERGWEIVAYPDGTLHLWSEGNGEETSLGYEVGLSEEKTNYLTPSPDWLPNPNPITYPYLFYEANLEKVFVKPEGFVVEGKNLVKFFRETLSQLGLNSKETHDFIDYWMTRLDSTQPFYFIHFLDKEQIEALEPLTIEEISSESWVTSYKLQVTSSIRIRAYFKPLQKWAEVPPQTLSSPPERKGFTLVEWGGLLDEGQN